MACITAPDVGSGPRRLRIVCISDTHGKHWDILPHIPPGDILVHAGDFSYKLKVTDKGWVDKILDFNAFLGALPHPHKIVIAGNHEVAFNKISPRDIRRMLSNCTYLEDSEVVIEGVKFYGTPWTNSCSMGFSKRSNELGKIWNKIPADTNVLITHLPPLNTLDLAYDHGPPNKAQCQLCSRCHPRYSHWGHRDLLARVQDIRPLVHIFGHVHDSNGCSQRDGTLFINAAMDLNPRPIVVDMYVNDVQAPSRTPTPSTPLVPSSVTQPMKSSEFVGVSGLKVALMSRSGLWRLNLSKLRRLFQKNSSVVLEEYPSWMLPVDTPGLEGVRYTVDGADVLELQQDSDYMEKYREAACLVVHLWGWDLLRNEVVTGKQLPVEEHLFLVAKSLRLFNQEDLLSSLRCFAIQLRLEGVDITHPQLLELLCM